ncbi:hypothetical protein [Trichocoleus sp. FACHB-591]|nr:hypothetical protein [Trichocoleus sp. FACHB-591]
MASWREKPHPKTAPVEILKIETVAIAVYQAETREFFLRSL